MAVWIVVLFMGSIEVWILRKQFPVEMFLENLMEVFLVLSRTPQLRHLHPQSFNMVLDSQEFSMVKLTLFKELLIILQLKDLLLVNNNKEINRHKEIISTRDNKVNLKKVKFTQKFKLCILLKSKDKFFRNLLTKAMQTSNKCFWNNKVHLELTHLVV